MDNTITEEDLSASTFNGYRTGCKRDSPDERDKARVYGSNDIPSKDVLPRVDLRKYILQVYNQKKLGSCTVNAICAAYELELKKEAEPHDYYYYHFDPSRLFLYYNARVIDGDLDSDKGVSLRDVLIAIHSIGVCRESLWPYNIRNYKMKPTSVCYDDAIGKRISKFEYLRQDIHQLRACLSQGHAFAFGYHIYRSFIIKEDGLMPMPNADDIDIEANKPIEGGHAGLAVGYDDDTRRITVLNSWGENWGDKGYFYMPYDFISNPLHAFNFWKIEKAEEDIQIVIQSNSIDDAV